MTGLPNFNREAFNTMAEVILRNGNIPLNPATLPAGLEQNEYMDICFAMVRAAEQVVFLSGWSESEGAQAEYAYSKKLGLELLMPDLKPFPGRSEFKQEKPPKKVYGEKVQIVCECGCGQSKEVRKADADRGWGKYFSKSCKAKHEAELKKEKAA